MQPSNKALQLKWFYMYFHSMDRANYVESRLRLSNEVIESVTEFFENIYKSQVANGSLAMKRRRQIEHRM
jgi:hypothetical protein